MPYPVAAVRNLSNIQPQPVDWSLWFDYAWIFKNAGSESASRIDAVSGVSLLPRAGYSAPAWSSIGLTCTAAALCLDTTIVPQPGYSMLVRFVNNAVSNTGCVAGCRNSSNSRFYLYPKQNGNQVIGYGAAVLVAGVIESGTQALCGGLSYANGVFGVDTAGTLTAGTAPISVGSDVGSSGFPANFFNGSIQFLGVKKATLTAGQVLAAHTAVMSL